MQNFMEAIKSGNSAREYEKILSNNAEGLDLLIYGKKNMKKFLMSLLNLILKKE